MADGVLTDMIPTLPCSVHIIKDLCRVDILSLQRTLLVVVLTNSKYLPVEFCDTFL